MARVDREPVEAVQNAAFPPVLARLLQASANVVTINFKSD
jgi:hypothetical protein